MDLISFLKIGVTLSSLLVDLVARCCQMIISLVSEFIYLVFGIVISVPDIISLVSLRPYFICEREIVTLNLRLKNNASLHKSFLPTMFYDN